MCQVRPVVCTDGHTGALAGRSACLQVLCDEVWRICGKGVIIVRPCVGTKMACSLFFLAISTSWAQLYWLPKLHSNIIKRSRLDLKTHSYQQELKAFSHKMSSFTLSACEAKWTCRSVSHHARTFVTQSLIRLCIQMVIVDESFSPCASYHTFAEAPQKRPLFQASWG